MRFIVGCLAVIAGHRVLDTLRNEDAPQSAQPFRHLRGHARGVGAGFLGDGQRNGRCLNAALQVDFRRRCPGPEPDVLFRLVRSCDDRGDVLEIHGLAIANADDQFGHVVAVGEKGTRGDWPVAILGDQRSRLRRNVAHLQRVPQRLDGQAVRGESLRIQPHVHNTVWAADRVDIARAGDPFDLGLDRMRDALQFMCAPTGILGPERDRDGGHVVDALRLDQRLHDAAAGRLPVLVRVHGVIQAYDSRRSILADLELDGQHGDAGLRNRIRMFHTLDFCQHLLHRHGNQVFDLVRTRAGKRHENIGKSDVDLRLFFARRHDDCEQAHEHTGQREQRRDLRILELASECAR